MEEQYQQTWAVQLKALLLEMKAATEQARAQGLRSLPATTRTAFLPRYRALLAGGHAANPPRQRRPRLSRRLGGNGATAAWTAHVSGLVLDDLQTQRRQLLHLPPLDPLPRLDRQRLVAGSARRRPVGDYVIGRRHQP